MLKVLVKRTIVQNFKARCATVDIVALEGKGVNSNIGQNETIMLGPSVMSARIGIGKGSTSTYHDN